ncbi:MAG: efflux RND transporter periplasmic adaptor subunit, partial [Deferribacteraceae bacterium]|nr:efflux RND transporter periplasmic adaptor subunit [Deferribacteraceae bacterium]
MKKIIIIGLILFFIVVILGLIFKRPPTQQIAAADTVRSAEIVVTLRQTGVIQPQVGAMIAIGARATGLLEEVRVKVGDRVEAGQLVARVDSRAVRQSIRQAKDSLMKAKVELNKAQTIHPVDVEMQKNTINTSKSNYEYLKDVYERENTLFEGGFSSQEVLDRAKHDMISAKLEHESQRLRLDYIIAEYNTTVESLTVEISRLASMLEEQQIQLSYTEIYSPISGIVSAVNSVEGETIVAGLEVAKLVTVFRPELMELRVYVDESDVGKVKEGMRVIYTLDTYPGEEFAGSISRIDLQSETRDGIIYYGAMVGISKADAIRFKPDMTASVRIITDEVQVANSVYAAAVKWENGSQVVYKIIDKQRGVTQRVPVKVGLRGEQRVEILEGLKSGDEVVVRFAASNAPLENAGQPRG